MKEIELLAEYQRRYGLTYAQATKVKRDFDILKEQFKNALHQLVVDVDECPCGVGITFGSPDWDEHMVTCKECKALTNAWKLLGTNQPIYSEPTPRKKVYDGSDEPF